MSEGDAVAAAPSTVSTLVATRCVRMQRTIAILCMAGAVGCATADFSRAPMKSPRRPEPPVFRCGLPQVSLVDQLGMGMLAAIVMGGVVLVGYTAIGGELPLH